MVTKTHNLHVFLSFAVLKTSDLSDWNANNSTICASWSGRAFCNWVGSRLIHIRFGSGPRPPLHLFGVHQSTIAVFTPAQKIRTKGGNEPELVLIKPNKTGVNTPLVKSWLLISDFSCYLWHLWSMLTVKSENRGKLVTSLTRNVNRDTAVRDNKLVTGQMLMLSEQSEMA